MRAVAYTELIILVRVFLGAITLQNSLLSPIIYAHFLRQRYYQSAFTREAVAVSSDRINGFVRKPGTSPVLVQVWEKVQMLVGRWVGSSVIQPTAGAEGTDGGAARRG